MGSGRIIVELLDPLPRPHPMLALSLQTAWHWGDAPLRAAIEAGIRALVQREPDLLAVFKSLVRTHQPLAGAVDGELAGLLLTIWALGDEPLREAAAQMIRDYGGRHPAFGPEFCTLAHAALADARVLSARGARLATETRLRTLITQIEEG
jgi:hypothetical protein